MAAAGGQRAVDESDATLAARAQHDQEAFAVLYDRYVEVIFRYCYRRLEHREAAEDATSLIFERALAALPRYRPGNFRSWLFTIAHNVVVNEGRRRRPVVSLDRAAAAVDPTPGPEEVAVAGTERQRLRDLLHRLSPDQRDVVELRLAGLSGPEIALVLGRSHGAVKGVQFRALHALRAMLVDETDGDTSFSEGNDDQSR